MTTIREPLTLPARRRGLLARAFALVGRHALTAYAALALAYLLIPIGVVALFPFNAPVGRFNYTWEGFTLENWRQPFAVPGLLEAMTTSLQVAVL